MKNNPAKSLLEAIEILGLEEAKKIMGDNLTVEDVSFKLPTEEEIEKHKDEPRSLDPFKPHLWPRVNKKYEE